MARIEIPLTTAREVLDKIHDHYPFMIFVEPTDVVIQDMRAWCQEMIGICGREPDDPEVFIETDGDWCYLAYYWFFKNADDVACFRMVFG